jgi:predicted kinase
MPVLFVVCGLPFSGKTMLAEKIARAADAVLVSYDALWRENWDARGVSLGWEELSEIAERRLARALDSGRATVYDTLNDTRGNRDRLRDLATRCGAQALIVFADTPLSVIEARRRENDARPTRHGVGDDDFRAALARFEPPQPDEPTRYFTPDTDERPWLAELRSLWEKS